MSIDKTPLQQAIKEAIEKHPTLDDKEIAVIAYESRYPDEKYEGTDPTFAYVAKMRRRIEQAGEPPEFIIEIPEEPEEPEEYEVETPEEPETPFPEDFEIPEPEEPFIDVETIEGFTLNDTEFILCFTFDKFADWSGYDGWRFQTDAQGNLSDRNEIRFAGLTHRIMEKYMPDLLDQYFLEIMFCYTGIMLIGSKAKGYSDWRKARKPVIKDLKDVESTIIETETPEEQEPEPETEPKEELPPGAKARGESGFMKRLRRQTQ